MAAPAIVANFTSALPEKIQSALTAPFVIWLMPQAIVGALNVFVSLRRDAKLTFGRGIVINLDGAVVSMVARASGSMWVSLPI